MEQYARECVITSWNSDCSKAFKLQKHQRMILKSNKTKCNTLSVCRLTNRKPCAYLHLQGNEVAVITQGFK